MAGKAEAGRRAPSQLLAYVSLGSRSWALFWAVQAVRLARCII